MGQSLGEKRVRVTFNPMSSDNIMFMKKEFAQIIDDLEKHKEKDSDPETMRLIATAQTKVEEAAMWAIKAITK